MTNFKTAQRLITSLAGTSNKIVADKTLCRFMGSLAGGVFLSQLLYWSDKGTQEGVFYKSYVEWEEEIMLSDYYVKKFADQCVELGFLKTSLSQAKGAPTVHYQFDFEIFVNRISEFLENQDFQKLANPFPKIRRSYNKDTEEYNRRIPVEEESAAAKTSLEKSREDKQRETDWSKILRYWKRNGGKLNEAIEQALFSLGTQYGFALVFQAVEQAFLSNKTGNYPTTNFVKAIAARMAQTEAMNRQRQLLINLSEGIAVDASDPSLSHVQVEVPQEDPEFLRKRQALRLQAQAKGAGGVANGHTI